jgi:hypothetical protein
MLNRQPKSRPGCGKTTAKAKQTKRGDEMGNRRRGLKLLLSLPAVLYLGCYVWLLEAKVFPICQTVLSDIWKLTIWQLVLVIFGFTLFLYFAVRSVMWLLVVWLGD